MSIANQQHKPTRQLLLLATFAIAFAYVEAAVVVHLRQIYYPDNPLQIFPLHLFSPRDLAFELLRESATVVMILSVASVAQRGFMRSFAAFVFVFGLWDIFYYVWLKLMLGWPLSWGEWDILFLIPWAWLGPWLTPVFVALLFVFWGGWVLQTPRTYHFTRSATLLFLGGTALALGAFLQPGFGLVGADAQAIAAYQPAGFWWWLFLPGLGLMATGLLAVLRQ